MKPESFELGAVGCQLFKLWDFLFAEVRREKIYVQKKLFLLSKFQFGNLTQTEKKNWKKIFGWGLAWIWAIEEHGRFEQKPKSWKKNSFFFGYLKWKIMNKIFLLKKNQQNKTGNSRLSRMPFQKNSDIPLKNPTQPILWKQFIKPQYFYDSILLKDWAIKMSDPNRFFFHLANYENDEKKNCRKFPQKIRNKILIKKFFEKKFSFFFLIDFSEKWPDPLKTRQSRAKMGTLGSPKKKIG